MKPEKERHVVDGTEPKTADPQQPNRRGRVKNAELAPGETYFAVYTPTGVLCFKTRNEDEAKEIVSRNPAKLGYMAHTKPGTAVPPSVEP